jgi:hypothetical protein
MHTCARTNVHTHTVRERETERERERERERESTRRNHLTVFWSSTESAGLSSKVPTLGSGTQGIPVPAIRKLETSTGGIANPEDSFSMRDPFPCQSLIPASPMVKHH